MTDFILIRCDGGSSQGRFSGAGFSGGAGGGYGSGGGGPTCCIGIIILIVLGLILNFIFHLELWMIAVILVISLIVLWIVAAILD